MPHTHIHKAVETVVSQSREHTSALGLDTSATVQLSDTNQKTRAPGVDAAKLRSQAEDEAALTRDYGATVASNYASVLKMQIIVT